jgi:uncharacterized repeat protein (TIGR01451 family)
MKFHRITCRKNIPGLRNPRALSLGLAAAMILCMVSCKGPMSPSNHPLPWGEGRGEGQCDTAANRMSSAQQRQGVTSTSDVRAVGYDELPSSAYTGAPPVMATDGSCPQECPCVESGMPLPYQAYGPWAPPGITKPWPADEYLRDGGDHGVGVAAVRNGEVRGLEMEDAVAEYNTLDGRNVVVPSNEVYVYSPRFGAVRQVVGVNADENLQALGAVHHDDHLLSPQVTEKVGSAKQQIQVENQIAALPAYSFRMKEGNGALSSALGPQGFSDAYKAYEDLAVIRWGKYKSAEKAHLARGVSAAKVWSPVQTVHVILDNRGPMELAKDEKTLSLVTTLPPGNPRLRIIKVASTPAALPGDDVWFTLRFDNVGQQVVGCVTVLDSLSTRLEYVEGSAQCSRKAKISTVPNEGGSQVLRCEVADPLKPGEGGVVRFRCIVR